MLSTTELPADAWQYCWHVRQQNIEAFCPWNMKPEQACTTTAMSFHLSDHSRFRPSEVADFKLSCTHSIPAGLSLWQSRRWTLHWQPWRPVRLQGWEESYTSVLKEQFDRSGKPSANWLLDFPGFSSYVSCICSTDVWWELNVWSDLKLPTV